MVDEKRRTIGFVRVLGACWVVAGCILVAVGIWGLTSEGTEYMPAFISWLIELGYASIGVFGGLGLFRGWKAGPILVQVASWIALIYALAWLFVGGVEDTGGPFGPCVPAFLALVGLSIWSISGSRRMPSRQESHEHGKPNHESPHAN